MPQFADVTQAETFSDFLKTLLDQVFTDSLPQHPKLYKAWLKESKAEKFRETESLLTGLGAMPSKPLGGKIQTDAPMQGTNKTRVLTTWGLGYVAEYELIRWDEWKLFGDMTSELTKSAVDRCNIAAYAIPNNAFSTTNSIYTVYNAEALCSTSHALKGGGTTSNRETSDTALSYSSLINAENDFALLQNERGRYVLIQPKCLMVYPSNRWYAETLMQSRFRPGTANNDKNVLGNYKVHGDSPYLSSTTAWFLTSSVSQLGKSMEFEVGDKPMHRKDFDTSTWNSTFTCYQSFRVRVYHYQGFWGSQGTG